MNRTRSRSLWFGLALSTALVCVHGAVADPTWLPVARPGAPGGRLRPTPRPPDLPVKSRPKNVIVMIGDGMGFNHLLAADLWQYGEARAQEFERWPVAMAMATWSESTRRAGGGPYDPEKHWSIGSWRGSPSIGGGGATDSAAAATAMACGVKTKDGAIGVDAGGRRVKNVVERAEELGKATGVVTSVPLSHATPAGFVAHNRGRGAYEAIAREMLLESGCEVIMGCGHPLWDNGGELVPAEKVDYRYVGGADTWRKLLLGLAGGASDRPAWKLIEQRTEFQALATGETPPRVCGVAQARETLQCGRPGVSAKAENTDAKPGDDPFNPLVPTLPEMTRAALNVLDNDPDGLFLMVEGGAIDWAAHSNLLARVIEETIDFQEAVAAVVEWVETHSSWDETLVIITADHETGYLVGPSWGKAPEDRKSGEQYDQNMQPAAAPFELLNRGAGELPGYQFLSGGHTNDLVPFYAKGCGSERFGECIVGTDPHRGPYLDNTAIARMIFAQWR